MWTTAFAAVAVDTVAKEFCERVLLEEVVSVVDIVLWLPFVVVDWIKFGLETLLVVDMKDSLDVELIDFP